MELCPVPGEAAVTSVEPVGRGTVARTTFFGAQTIVQISLDSGETIAAMALSHRAPSTGTRVEVRVSGPVLAYPLEQPSSANPCDEPNVSEA
jgi:hypothetical protein